MTCFMVRPPFDPSVPADEPEPAPISALYLCITEPVADAEWTWTMTQGNATPEWITIAGAT